jgi:hypothetical protein
MCCLCVCMRVRVSVYVCVCQSICWLGRQGAESGGITDDSGMRVIVRM